MYNIQDYCTGLAGESTWSLCLLSMTYERAQYESNLCRQKVMLAANQAKASVGHIVVCGMEQAKHFNEGRFILNHLSFINHFALILFLPSFMAQSHLNTPS